MAAVKLLVARPKDLTLVRRLLVDGLLKSFEVRARIEAIPFPAENLARPLAHLRSMAT